MPLIRPEAALPPARRLLAFIGKQAFGAHLVKEHPQHAQENPAMLRVPLERLQDPVEFGDELHQVLLIDGRNRPAAELVQVVDPSVRARRWRYGCDLQHIQGQKLVAPQAARRHVSWIGNNMFFSAPRTNQFR